MATFQVTEMLLPGAVGAGSAIAALFSANAQKSGKETTISKAAPIAYDYGVAAISVGGRLTGMVDQRTIPDSVVHASLALAARRLTINIGSAVMGLSPQPTSMKRWAATAMAGPSAVVENLAGEPGVTTIN